MTPYESLAARAVVRRTPCGDGHMVWRCWGEGEPVVLLHGGSGSWTHWVRNIGALCARRRVLAADLPGLGESDLPPAPFHRDDLAGSVDMLAGVVADGLTVLEESRGAIDVVGFSLGSIVGTFLAARLGPRVRRLILAGGSALGTGWPGLAGRLVTPGDDATEAEHLCAQRHNLSLLMLHRVDPDDALAPRLQLDNVRRARIRSHPLAGSDVMHAALPRVVSPITSIWGRHDPYAFPDPHAAGEVIRHHHPDARVEVVDGAGHWVMYERPETFNPLLLDALTEPPAEEGGPRC